MSGAAATSAREGPSARPAAAPGSAVTEAADLASGLLAARLSDQRVEVLSDRTEATTTWANPDGTVTTDAASGPVRFRDAATGTWRDIDITLKRSRDGVAAAAHPLGLTLAGKTAVAGTGARNPVTGRAARPAPLPLVRLDAGDGRAMTLSWRGALPEPKLSGTKARYPGVLTATDLIVEATRTGFEQFLELKDRSAVGPTSSVTLTLKAKGIRARANKDRSVTFLDRASGRRVGELPAPVMWDATVNATSGEHTRRADVGLKVVQRGDDIDLTLTPDARFIADPATKFPVTVDPAVNIGTSFDTFVQQGTTTDQSAATELKLGNNGSGQIARSFLSFPMARITGKQILSAKLNLWNHHSWSCAANKWEVWDTPGATTASRWGDQPGWNNLWATTSATKGHSSGCADGWVNQNITSLATAWAANGNGTNHLGIRATDETTPDGWKRFHSGNAATNTPFISVTYNTPPTAGRPMAASPGRTFPALRNWTTSTTPTLTYAAKDAEGTKLRVKWEVWDAVANTNVLLHDPGTATLNPGSTASYTVPPGLLTHGRTYWFWGRAHDGSAWSDWSPKYTFAVDTAKPGTTSVTSTDFPAGVWSGTPGADGRFSGSFTFTPPGTDVLAMEYKLDAATTWTEIRTLSSPNTRTLTFPAGKRTLTTRTRDLAGNASNETTYTFYAGSGAALPTPAQGDRPARRAALAAEGLTSYTGATYQYRRGETDTWKNVPLADVRTASGGGAVAAWPVPVTGGKAERLNWNLTDTLATDGPIEVRASFTDGTSTAASPANEITVDRDAGTAPTEEAGPGSVNLLTGDYNLTANDVSLFGLSVSRTASSRRPNAGEQQVGQAAIFGPQWTSGTVTDTTGSDWGYLKQTSASSVAVVDAEGGELGFTATTGGGWKAEPGADDFTLTGSLTGSLTLKDTGGTVTVFTKPAPAATTWQVATTTLDGLGQTTTVVSETVATGGATRSRPTLLIAPTSAVPAATCATTPSTRGCRALEFVYATATTATASALGDVTGQVKEIRGWSTDPGASTATSKVVRKYRYDTSGRLRETDNPQISPALTTEYGYDAAGRITTYTPPGLLPWSLTYGQAGNAATAGPGMLLKASRSGLQPGTADVPSGTASTSIVYDVPLTGTAAPHQMGGADVQAWGQSDAPTDATAVFPADSVPAAHSGGSLAAGDYARASLTYTDASGREVNAAEPGGHIGAIEYDHHGNTVRELSAGNRALALGATATTQAALTELGVIGLSAKDRAELLSTRRIYDAKGTRELEELGPLRRVTSAGADGTTPARSWTVNEYDAGRPTDGSAKVANQVTKVSTGAQVLGSDTMSDTRVVQTTYDWAKGVPLTTVKDPGGLAITETSEYDTRGRITKQRLPGASGSDAATRVTAYWSATGTGSCAGRPEWADQLCSTGPGGAITGGGANPDQLPTTTSEYDWWGNPTRVTETANTTTRTTTVAYDGAGRATGSTLSGGTGQAVPSATTEYDTLTGLVTRSVSTTGGTITRAYDKLGRPISYTDADGGVTTTQYDLLDRPVRTGDSVPSTVTYAYNTTTDPRGLVTSVTDSVAGTFNVTYDADGSVATEQLPGGYTLTVKEDSTGSPRSRIYTRDSDGEVVLSDTVSESVHHQVAEHAGWSSQDYAYDAIGRLTKVADTVGDTCTTRTYSFGARTNRTSLNTATGTAGAACPTTGGTTTTHTYDSADRLVDSGYGYDAFGRTTDLPGSTVGYYANDLVHRQTAGDRRQTWQLDATHRLRSWTTEENTAGTWTPTGAKVNHYSGDNDSPRWITEDTTDGTVSRNVSSASGDLAAVTTATGDTMLQLTNIHGDVALQLPLTPADAPVVLDNDEYGNPRTGQPATRYNWLGGQQRSTETPTGLTLMGVRLYNPATGRFLSPDPVHGGNLNAYEYAHADPVNRVDLDGMWSKTKRYHWGSLYVKVSKKRKWGVPYLQATLEFRFNRSYTAKIGRNAHFFYGPFWAGVGHLGVPGKVIGWIGAAYSGLVQMAANRAASKKQCLTVGIRAKILPVWYSASVYYFGRRC
ncbi:DNRLRE domain-containing protein [Streptomyces sp. NPDC057638]|uniref:DNRLRE domain-containing protein n=1 Tax=Streptomyces sp. NPDC057638 TaxID=3346190 RepID=UPI0036A4F442